MASSGSVKRARNKAIKKWRAIGQRRCYCGRLLTLSNNRPHSATLEHIIPISMGGSNHEFNLLIVCADCNSRRGNQNWEVWFNKKQPPNKEWYLKKYAVAVNEYYDRRDMVDITCPNVKSVFKYLDSLRGRH